MDIIGSILLIFIGVIIGILISAGFIAIQDEITSFGVRFVRVDAKPEEMPVFNLSCPQPICPELKQEGIQCQASCSNETKIFESCHIPDYMFERITRERSYTGNSNTPAIFSKNSLKTVERRPKDVWLPGCFYGFEYKGKLTVHRLWGNYENYLLFEGDNSNHKEEVDFDAVKFLVTGIRST